MSSFPSLEVKYFFAFMYPWTHWTAPIAVTFTVSVMRERTVMQQNPELPLKYIYNCHPSA